MNYTGADMQTAEMWDRYAAACKERDTLHTRIAQLETALRGLLDTMDWDDTVEKAEAIDTARAALALA